MNYLEKCYQKKTKYGLPKILMMRQDLKRICRKYRLSLVILFGSGAEGNLSKESDIDLGVWTEEKRIDIKYEMNLLTAMVNFLKRDGVDLVILNFADPLLRFEVATKGRLIYEKDEGGFRDFKIQAMKQNNDAQKFYNLDRLYIKNFLKGARSDAYRECHPPQVGKIG